MYNTYMTNNNTVEVTMKYIVDIDGTICTHTAKNEYARAKPYEERIKYFNKLYDKGDEIHYWTARGSSSGIDWTDLTRHQLDVWGVKYTKLSLGKPSYDRWIDDKAFNVDHFFSELGD